MSCSKSHLLASGSIAALATFFVCPQSFAQTGDDRYWAPWAETEIQIGHGDPMGSFRSFAPIAQGSASLLYLDASLGGSESTNFFGSFGFGARGILNDKIIVGGSAFYNTTRSDTDEKFDGFSLGAEALTDKLDFRVNYHHTASDDRLISSVGTPRGTGSTFSFEGNRLVETSGGRESFERGFSGVEGEVGAKVPFPLPGNAELRVYGGGFHYTNSLGPNVSGPRARAELRIFDVFGTGGYLLSGARLTIGGSVRNDSVRGTEGTAELRLRIPFGASERAHPNRGSLVSRMTERVERDEPILRVIQTVDTLTTRSAVNPATNTEYGLFAFADGANTTGAGTQADPTTFDDGVAKAGAGGILVVEGGVGTVTTSGATLLDGQTVIGGGGEIPVLRIDGTTMTMTLPGQSGVVSGTGSNPVITLANNNTLSRFSITGGTVGVTGTDVNNFTLTDMDISSMAGASFTNVTGTGHINETMITSTSGIGLFVDNSLLAPTDFTLSTMGVSIDATGGAAIDIDPLTVDASFDSVTSNGGARGIHLDEVFGTFVVTGAVNISNTTDDGIEIRDGGARIDFKGPVTISNAGGDGLDIENHSGDVNFDGPLASNSAVQGLSFGNYTGVATFNGAVDVDTTTGVGIDIDGGTVSFTGGLDVDTTSGAGINVTGGGTININGGTVDSATGTAINLSNANAYFDNVLVGGTTPTTSNALSISDGGGTSNVQVTNSTFISSGFTLDMVSGSGTINATLLGNVFQNSGGIIAANIATTGGDMCLDLNGGNIGSNSNTFTGFALIDQSSGTFSLEGLAFDSAPVASEAFLELRNTFSVDPLVVGTTYTAVLSCPLP